MSTGTESFPESSPLPLHIGGDFRCCVRGDPGTGAMAVCLGRLCVSVRAVCAQYVGYGGAIRGGIRAHQPALSARWHMVRHLSASPSLTINYEELKDLLKNDGVFLIDVREPWEIKEYGIIKESINIPLGDLPAALQLTPEEFEAKYHKKLPEKSNTVVFSCLAGIRSGRALEVATTLGYSRIHHYTGGFNDWTRHEAPEKPQ